MTTSQHQAIGREHRIALVAPDDFCAIIFCKPLCEELRRCGYQSLHTFSPVGTYAAELAGIPGVHTPIAMERFIAPIADARYIWQLFRHLRQGRFDTVITFTTKPNAYGVPVAKLAGVRNVVAAVRGLGAAFSPPEGLADRAVSAFVGALYHLACRLSNRVWFTNRNDLALFAQRGYVNPKKALLTKNGIDLESFSQEVVSSARIAQLRKELGMDDSEQAVIMVARLIWSKGVGEFVEAARSLRERLPRLRFLLIAPAEAGSPGSVPVDYVRTAERQANFTWLGFRKDVVDLYALSELAVLPSYYKEGGYPRALLEPMALGKPVIAADTDDCRGPVEPGRNGYLVPARDARALAEAIAKIIEDDRLRAEFGRRSLEKVRSEFDVRRVAREVIAKLGLLNGTAVP